MSNEYEGIIANCYNIGAVHGKDWVGGLVGSRYEYDYVMHSYSAGTVYGESHVGGLVGGSQWTDTDPTAIYCFWDIQTSGQATSASGMGKTTAEMQTASTFLGWGWTPTVWTIDEGIDYPRLAWEDKPGKRLPPLPEFIGGSGTQGDPYLISTADDLNMIGLFLSEWDKHFKLMADIDLSGYDGKDGRPGFKIIGTRHEIAFTGVFDGNGHTISHLTVQGKDHVGLFGQLDDGEVKNLGLVDVNMTASGSRVGGLVGESRGAVTRCHSTGAVSGTDTVGGLVGFNDYGTVTHCYGTSAVTGTGWAVGGLVGENRGNVTQCYSRGAVSADYGAGGLVGSNLGTVIHCYSTGLVSGTGDGVGGLVGSTYKGTVTGCFWDMHASGQAKSAGGTGKTTAEMQMAKMFLHAGWDFVGETANGTEDLWWINEGKDYPRLWWEPRN